MIFALLVLACAGLYFSKPEERRRLAAAVIAYARDAHHSVRERREHPHDALHALLFERTSRTLIMPLAIALSIWMTLAMLIGGAGADRAQDLIAAGAHYVPRTTNGEWWRLLSYSFVHAGLIHLAASVAVLLPLGMLLERAVGHVAFAAVYVAAGIVAAALTLWTAPTTTVTAGASGAVFGLIGLLVAVIAYGYLRQPRLPFSIVAAKRLGAGCAVFAIYNLATDHVSTVAELAGLFTGLVAGLVIARRVVSDKPALGLSFAVTAAACAVAVALALPLTGTIDARPDLARIAEVESRTASEYAKAVAEYTRGRVTAKALAQLIQRSILPAIKADRARVDRLHGVPAEQAALVADARQYFELREASWQTRVGGLLGAKMRALQDAEKTERAALDALERLQRQVGAAPLS